MTSRSSILVALVVALAIVGCGSDGGDTSAGQIVRAPGKGYRVEMPEGLVKVPPRKDRSIPSKTSLSFELADKPQAGGLIKLGTLAGPAAHATFDEVGEEAARGYADQYEGHPDLWGRGAKVQKKAVKLGGQDAIAISARFSPSGKPTPSVFFRVYFVDAPSGPPILITCDWNSTDTEDIADACGTLVSSFRVT